MAVPAARRRDRRRGAPPRRGARAAAARRGAARRRARRADRRPTPCCSGRGPATAPRPSAASRGCASRWAWTTTCAPSTTRFRRDPLIGPSLRRAPAPAHPPPARALRGAGLGGLRAAHRVRARDGASSGGSSRRLGPRCARTGLRDVPAAGTLAGTRARPAGVLRPGRPACDHAAPRRPRGRRGPLRPRTPTTSAPGGACARSRASAPGRSRCSPSTARAATTSFPPPTSGTSSSSAGCARAATRTRARRRTRSARSSPPTSEWAGLAGWHALGVGPA